MMKEKESMKRSLMSLTKSMQNCMVRQRLYHIVHQYNLSNGKTVHSRGCFNLITSCPWFLLDCLRMCFFKGVCLAAPIFAKRAEVVKGANRSTGWHTAGKLRGWRKWPSWHPGVLAECTQSQWGDCVSGMRTSSQHCIFAAWCFEDL